MQQAETIRKMLAPGGRLDAGRVWEVVELIEGRPGRLAQLVECLWDDNPAVASRAADALERLTRDKPGQAQRWKDELLGLLAEAMEKKLRWNLALVIPRLKLTLPSAAEWPPCSGAILTTPVRSSKRQHCMEWRT